MKKIQILGTGCAKCQKLAENAEAAARELGVPYELEKVTDIQQIMAFRVMTMPAMIVDGVVKIAGKVRSPRGGRTPTRSNDGRLASLAEPGQRRSCGAVPTRRGRAVFPHRRDSCTTLQVRLTAYQPRDQRPRHMGRRPCSL